MISKIMTSKGINKSDDDDKDEDINATPLIIVEIHRLQNIKNKRIFS